MINNIKIGPKLIGGFVVVALITLVIGLLSVSNMSKLNQMVHTLYKNHLIGINYVKGANVDLAYIGRTYRGMLLAQSPAERQSLEKALNDYDKDLRAKLDSTIGTLTTEKGKEVAKKLTDQYNDYFKTVQNLVEIINKQNIIKLDQTVNDALEAIKSKAVNVDNLMNEMSVLKENVGKEMYDESNAIYVLMRSVLIICVIIATLFGILLGLFLSINISKPLSKVVSKIQDMANGEINDKLSINRGDEIGILSKSMDTLVDTMKSLIVEDGGVVLDAAANKDLTKRMKNEYKGQFLRMKENINRVIDSLDNALTQVFEATEQVSSASQQISAGSQSLAQGANEQASSLEEVSSSLEEMSSMTKQNAENANQAKMLSSEANNNAITGTEAMSRMSESISKIKESSDQTAKIVKTIDEIAMQTNLLALNAAVEAARAGEAGRGFAVVAEEVRNLAQRSAQAAKNTADMIYESVKNAEDGVQIAAEVSKSFQAIADSAKKVNDLIAEIAAASQEQAQGIDQINTAVAQMDKVTQQNAANSEESASAAEELSSQAEELQSMVAQFTLSQTIQKKNVTFQHQNSQIASAAEPKNIKASFNNGKNGKRSLKKTEMSGRKSAEELIPLDKDILREF